MKPRIIDELEILIEQATNERSHYYVKSVAKKAILAIGMLMDENKRLAKVLNEIAQWTDGELGGHMDEPACARIAREALRITSTQSQTWGCKKDEA